MEWGVLRHASKYANQRSTHANYQVMPHTSNIRGLVEASHWLSMNLGGKATVIHPGVINTFGECLHKGSLEGIQHS